MVGEREVLEALRGITDPDLGRDIVELGFVRDLKIEGGEVRFDLALTTPACPVRHTFVRQAEERVGALPGVASVKVRLTTLPASRSAAGPQPAGSGLEDVRTLIAVSSCKGGVGKSTVAAYFALNLARRGFRVGLVDADIYGPSVPTIFHRQHAGMQADTDQRLIPLDVDGLKIVSFGFLLGDGPAVLRGPLVSRYVQQMIHAVRWGALDYLFIDMPPGTGDIQLTITQTMRLDGAVIVTTPQNLSLVDVARGILMFEKVEVPVVGIVENMAYFRCDRCGTRHDVFGRGGGGALADRFGIPVLAEIPMDPRFSGRIDEAASDDAITAAVDAMARSLGRNLLRKGETPGVRIEERGIVLTWPDGRVWRVPHRDLRLACRCALCVDEITGAPLLQEAEIPADIRAVEVTPLGLYALGVSWSDGHASGIYPYRLLEGLAVKEDRPATG